MRDGFFRSEIGSVYVRSSVPGRDMWGSCNYGVSGSSFPIDSSILYN